MVARWSVLQSRNPDAVDLLEPTLHQESNSLQNHCQISMQVHLLWQPLQKRATERKMTTINFVLTVPVYWVCHPVSISFHLATWLMSCSKTFQGWVCSGPSRWMQSERACPPSSPCPSSPCWQRSSWSSWFVACPRFLWTCWRSWCVTATSPRPTSSLTGSGRAWRSSPTRSGCFSCGLFLAGPGCLPTRLISLRSSKSSRLTGWAH